MPRDAGKDARLAAHVARHPDGITTFDLAALMGVNSASVSRRARYLQETGRLVRVGSRWCAPGHETRAAVKAPHKPCTSVFDYAATFARQRTPSP